MAGWNDYLPDWSAKEKLLLCSEYDALSALVAAVNERGSVLSSYTPLPTVNRLYPVKYYVDLIDAKIKSIIPQFVNHTVNGGDFTGLDAIPMWTNGAIREYGLRPDGTQKEMGFFGEIVCAEDSETVFTEISVGVNINGTEMDVPTLVPTLTDAELLYMITEGYKVAPSEWPNTIIEKASLHAQQRIAANLSPFASDGEQTYRAGFNYRHSRLMPVIDWIYQQYEIINKLRWRTGNFEWNHGYTFPDGLPNYKLARYNGNVSYGSMVADYNASAWGREDPDYYWYGFGHWVNKAIPNTGYSSIIWRGRDSHILQFNDTDSFLDCYCIFSGNMSGGIENYVNNDYPDAEKNKLYRFENNITAIKGTQINLTLSNLGNCSILESDLVLDGGGHSLYFGGYGVARLPGSSGGYYGGYYTRKFTGANGFQFRDW